MTGLAAAWCLIRPVLLWDELPAVMASHFSAGGAADGSSSKVEFFVFFGVTLGLVVASLLGSVLLIAKIPAKSLNLPHKEYWLDGRLPEARRRMSRAMWWMTAATTLLCACVLELVLQANLHRSPLHEGAMWLVLGAYGVFTLVWTVRLLTSFTPPDN